VDVYEVQPRKDHRGVDLISDAIRALKNWLRLDRNRRSKITPTARYGLVIRTELAT
jgi:hypothetical protein